MKSLKSVNVSSISISPLTRWIITIVVLVALLAVVVVLYTQQQTRNSGLKDDLSTAQANLIKYSLQKSDLEARLIEANLSLSQLTAQFASTDESMGFEEALYGAAAATGVQVTSMNCGGPQAVTVGSISYKKYTVSIVVLGDVEATLRFMNSLGDWVPSAGISNASLSPGEGGQADLNLSLDIYGYGA